MVLRSLGVGAYKQLFLHFEFLEVPDFIFKMQTSMKECAETGYWLDVIEGAEILHPDVVKDLRYKRNRIHRMLVSTLNTKKANMRVK